MSYLLDIININKHQEFLYKIIVKIDLQYNYIWQ